jgi:hypothetical protein
MMPAREIGALKQLDRRRELEGIYDMSTEISTPLVMRNCRRGCSRVVGGDLGEQRCFDDGLGLATTTVKWCE